MRRVVARKTVAIFALNSLEKLEPRSFDVLEQHEDIITIAEPLNRLDTVKRQIAHHAQAAQIVNFEVEQVYDLSIRRPVVILEKVALDLLPVSLLQQFAEEGLSRLDSAVNFRARVISTQACPL